MMRMKTIYMHVKLDHFGNSRFLKYIFEDLFPEINLFSNKLCF